MKVIVQCGEIQELARGVRGKEKKDYYILKEVFLGLDVGYIKARCEWTLGKIDMVRSLTCKTGLRVHSPCEHWP